MPGTYPGNAFVASGIPVKATNIDGIPNQSAFYLKGNSSVRDSFRTVYRVVLPVSFVSGSENSPPTFSDDIDKYLAYENKNILVRYLSPEAHVAKNGFPLPRSLTGRWESTRERWFVARPFTLCCRLSNPAMASLSVSPNAVSYIFNVPKCLQGCYGGGDNEDTVYMNSDRLVRLVK